jgi:hypothetical protein
MRSEQWKTYRTRFLVNAKQLDSSLSFTDHLGRQHCGQKGDYLVESSDGVITIAPRQIFEDIYVPMSDLEGASAQPIAHDPDSIDATEISLKHLDVEPLEIERIHNEKLRRPSSVPRRTSLEESSRGRRKSPQPVRDVSTRVSLM